MIVDQHSLKVMPISDLLMLDKTGIIQSEVDNGSIAWSNELTAHVIELKTNGPVPILDGLDHHFALNITEINQILLAHGAKLLPGPVHPFMDPFTETRLWAHEFNQIYALYNKIFDCRGHGWSNLQSTHINLPFSSDNEFEKLHAAIRLILPLIPALTAGSPILEYKLTGYHDSRMFHYLTHQQKMPELMGDLIPEAVFSKAEYERIIFNPIQNAILPFDPEGIMEKYFLNSRGAIARFDRGAIEIRVMDVQEAPLADISLVQLISLAIQMLVDQQTVPLTIQKQAPTLNLKKVLELVIQTGAETIIDEPVLIEAFGLTGESWPAIGLWQMLFEKNKDKFSPTYLTATQAILETGPLSSRLLSRMGQAPSKLTIHDTWHELAECLNSNRIFLP